MTLREQRLAAHVAAAFADNPDVPIWEVGARFGLSHEASQSLGYAVLDVFVFWLDLRLPTWSAARADAARALASALLSEQGKVLDSAGLVMR